MSSYLDAEDRRETFLVRATCTLGDGEDDSDRMERYQTSLEEAVRRVAARVEAGLEGVCRGAGAALLPYDDAGPEAGRDGARRLRVEVVDDMPVSIEICVRTDDPAAAERMAAGLRRLARPA